MELKNKYPKVYADFEKWLKNYINHLPVKYIITYLDFTRLSFEMQLGVYLKYIEETNMDIWEINLACLAENDFKLAKDAISEAFRVKEYQLTKIE